MLFSTLTLKPPVLRDVSFKACYDWLTYQRPLAIACECFDNMIKIKWLFPDKAF